MTSVLIVDDDPVKVAAIESALFGFGLAKCDVVVARHAAAARVALHEKRFDLLLLDVLLPVRDGAPPRGDTSVELLRQIMEDHAIVAPRNIVAITADEAALQEHIEDFRALTTQVLRVAVGVDAWKASLKILIEHCSRDFEERSSFKLDVCLQTATRVEYEEVVRSWTVEWGDERVLTRGVLYRTGTIDAAGQELKVACAHAADMGLVAAADLTGKIISLLRPRLLLMTGICGGVGAEMKIGDIIVADKAWNWQSGKLASDQGFESSADQKDCSPELLAMARKLIGESPNLEREWDGDRPERRGKIHIAPMVSGSAVVADAAIHDALRRQHRKVGAVDMEAFAVYYVANMSDLSPRAIAIKGVSDLANSEKADWAQPYCAFVSARFAEMLALEYFS